jgi:hypothetical protein
VDANRADERQHRIGPTDGTLAPKRSSRSRRDTGKIDDKKRQPQWAEVIAFGRFHIESEYNKVDRPTPPSLASYP